MVCTPLGLEWWTPKSYKHPIYNGVHISFKRSEMSNGCLPLCSRGRISVPSWNTYKKAVLATVQSMQHTNFASHAMGCQHCWSLWKCIHAVKQMSAQLSKCLWLCICCSDLTLISCRRPSCFFFGLHKLFYSSVLSCMIHLDIKNTQCNKQCIGTSHLRCAQQIHTQWWYTRKL